MANISSGMLFIGRRYTLGIYTFSINDMASSHMKFDVEMSNETRSYFVRNIEVGAPVNRWSVEANDTTADVYVHLTNDQTVLAARFAIDLNSAGGSGSGSDWNNPGDGGDPDYTLVLNVVGALSGRHNDPLYDSSYSYTPADNTTVKNYGCGGDGGHGGGGGAGASTVIVRSFATDRAGAKEINAYAKRHGYGSGGGKGGKGGDGCILIYY